MDYELVQLRNGNFSMRSRHYGETLHPGVGPAAEGEALYVRQLRLRERIATEAAPFIIWDVGLGAAANAISVWRAVGPAAQLHMISFDSTLEPLKFALANTRELNYLDGFETPVEELCTTVSAELGNGRWEVRVADFPKLINGPEAENLPKPHAILYDPFSPARNPEMWTQLLFARMFQLLGPRCSLATFSRSTMIRASLLLAGLYVGAGYATGEKEETTIAANAIELIEAPLNRQWLERARRSTSAEPLWDPVFRKTPLAAATLARLESHPQFAR
jgi:tRNA U34 5-methylaminomethyl-2-thiouridine-forming methyltransferase MnmC